MTENSTTFEIGLLVPGLNRPARSEGLNWRNHASGRCGECPLSGPFPPFGQQPLSARCGVRSPDPERQLNVDSGPWDAGTMCQILTTKCGEVRQYHNRHIPYCVGDPPQPCRLCVGAGAGGYRLDHPAQLLSEQLRALDPVYDFPVHRGVILRSVQVRRADPPTWSRLPKYRAADRTPPGSMARRVSRRPARLRVARQARRPSHSRPWRSPFASRRPPARCGDEAQDQSRRPSPADCQARPKRGQ